MSSDNVASLLWMTIKETVTELIVLLWISEVYCGQNPH